MVNYMKNAAFGYIRVSGKGQIKGDGFLAKRRLSLIMPRKTGLK